MSDFWLGALVGLLASPLILIGVAQVVCLLYLRGSLRKSKKYGKPIALAGWIAVSGNKRSKTSFSTSEFYHTRSRPGQKWGPEWKWQRVLLLVPTELEGE